MVLRASFACLDPYNLCSLSSCSVPLEAVPSPVGPDEETGKPEEMGMVAGVFPPYLRRPECAV